MLSFRRSLLMCTAFAVAAPALADEVVATVKPVVMPANTGKPDAFTVVPGFQVELIYSVPKEKYGSWVCVTTDPKGRLIASDQEGKGLCRITPGKIGTDEPSKIEKLSVKITAAQGLLFAFDSLYVSANGGPGSGLWRINTMPRPIRLTNRSEAQGDPRRRRAWAARVAAVAGRQVDRDASAATTPCRPRTLTTVALPKNWGEDHLLPRQWDANGHARGILAPGGWVAKTDPDGKTWEIFSSGYRNPYDLALNADGELFVLRLRHGVGLGHAVVSADPRHPCDQRQRVRLAQRHRQLAGVLHR